MPTPYIAQKTVLGIGPEALDAYGTKVVPSIWAGIIPNFDAPDPKIDIKGQWSMGNGRDFLQTTVGKRTLETSFPVIWQKPNLMTYAFGYCKDVGTAVGGGGGSTLDGAIAAGDTVFDVVAGTNYAADDYIEVDTGGNPEIRQITGVATNAITVDFAFRRAHVTGATCGEVEAPFVHTFYKHPGPSLPSFTLEASMQEDTADFSRFFTGTVIDTCEWSCDEEGIFKGNLGIKSAKPDSGASPSTITADSTTEPLMFHHGEITAFGSTIARTVDTKIRMNNRQKLKYYQQSSEGYYAYEALVGKRENDAVITMVPDSDDIWDQIATATPASSTVIVQYSRSANDYWKFTGTDAWAPSAPHNFPEEHELNVPIEFIIGTLELEVKDAVGYY